MVLAQITAPDRPYTRLSFAALLAKGCAWLAWRFWQAGPPLRTTSAGNLIAQWGGVTVRADCSAAR